MREEGAALVREDAVIARLGLGVGRQVRAQRQALDRAWERGQLIREETRQPPLKRVWLGKRDRYGYPADVVEELINTLLSPN